MGNVTNTDQRRVNHTKIDDEGIAILSSLKQYIGGTGMEPLLVKLVKLRASQMHGCACRIAMHTKDARTQGESKQRLYGVSTCRESPFYSERERVALPGKGAGPAIRENPVPDELYDQGTKHFSTQKELVDLTMVVLTINSWNRLAIP